MIHAHALPYALYVSACTYNMHAYKCMHMHVTCSLHVQYIGRLNTDRNGSGYKYHSVTQHFSFQQIKDWQYKQDGESSVSARILALSLYLPLAGLV